VYSIELSIIIDVAVAVAAVGVVGDVFAAVVVAMPLAILSIVTLLLLLMKFCRWISSNRSIIDLSTTTLCDNSITFCMFECKVTCKCCTHTQLVISGSSQISLCNLFLFGLSPVHAEF